MNHLRPHFISLNRDNALANIVKSFVFPRFVLHLFIDNNDTAPVLAVRIKQDCVGKSPLH